MPIHLNKEIHAVPIYSVDSAGNPTNASTKLVDNTGATPLITSNYPAVDGWIGGTVSPVLATGSFGMAFNGTTWDRVRGDTSGAWTHAPQNTVSGALSGTIATTGGTASIPFINTARQEVHNPSSAILWASWAGAPTPNGAGSFQIAAGASYSTDRTTGTLQLLSTADAQSYTVHRFS
ncbi:hypothetical protein OKW76_00345 [Sphingomonas sp. S1-29]|uniref:hypothetical protein n=1 Tax=Sphingomonas sp. S1-29 TaxID=2991074 RepID=UPI002240780C|nr:hypothetical protein [Sphingomonas sp. S1-29]UZK69574.1 hypothetical protein OKW76_00345 [Sphingomonas sp. S1-29]